MPPVVHFERDHSRDTIIITNRWEVRRPSIYFDYRCTKVAEQSMATEVWEGGLDLNQVLDIKRHVTRPRGVVT